MMVSGRLLSGFTYLEISNKMNLKEDAIRTPGISHVFNLLYDFIISAVYFFSKIFENIFK